MRVLRDLMVPMRDGVRLAVDLYLPGEEGRYPALLALSPYGKGKQTLQTRPQPASSPLWDGGVEAGDPAFLTANGYVHAIGDVRGVNKSEGVYRGWMSKQEGEDGYDLVEWIAAQPWCDGNVGMVGISYFGTIQLHVAAEQPPHLRAIMPWNGVADFYREATHHGGMLQTFFYELYTRSCRGTPVSVTAEEHDPDSLALLVEELKADPDLQQHTVLWHIADNANTNPSFFDVLAHPFDGPFYWERSAYRHHDRIRVPVYARSAWWAYAHMHLQGTFDHFTGIDAPVKILIDRPVDEERPLPRAYDEEVLRWYDHWLKGRDTGIVDEAPVRLFLMGGGGWIEAHEWPLPETEWRRLYLHPWGGLEPTPPHLDESVDVFVQQPPSETNDVATLAYTTEPFATDVDVVGPLSVTLHAAIDSEDANWIVAVRDVDPAGRERELTRGFLKASHRELDPERSTEWRPYHPHLRAQPVPPGEVLEYRIALSPTANRFRAGHRLRLCVLSLDYRGNPAPPPGVSVVHYPWHVARSETVTHTIHHDSTRPSSLLIPVRPR